MLAKDVGYLNNSNVLALVEQTNTAHKILQGLISKTKSFLNQNS